MTRTVLFEDLVAVKIDNRGKTPPLTNSGYPLLEVNAISKSRLYPDLSKVSKFVDKETYDSWFRQHLAKDDILFTTVGTIAESAIIPDGSTATVAQNILGFRFKPNLMNPLFALYLMRSRWFLDQIRGRTIETVQKSIKWTDMRKIKISLPDLETQKKIADILGTIDEKIELNRQMNETLEQMGQVLFRHYFIDNSEAEKWGEKMIGELCNVKIGRTPPRKESEWFDKDDGEAWVSIKDMGQGATFMSDSSEYLTEGAVAKFNVPVIEPNTLLLSFKLTVGRLCISTKRMYSNEAIAQLPLKSSEVSTEYLYYFLRNFNYSQLSSTSSIATAVNSTTVKSIKVTAPTETVMKGFTTQARNILEAVKNNEAEIQTLTTLRDTLLPRLISGKVIV